MTPSLFSIAYLANALGTSDAALRLLLSVLVGYPIAIFNRKVIHKKSATVHHLYSIGTGIALGYFNFGQNLSHCIITLTLTYLIIHYVKGMPMLILSWVCNFGYLCVGYFYTETDDYDILWTMPQCVLCLKLIGLSFDVYDSFYVPVEKRVASRKLKYLTNKPSLLEIFGFGMFPTTFLIGPQFPFARYLRFVSNNFEDKPAEKFELPGVSAVATKFALGLFYLGVSQAGAAFLPNEYFLSSHYKSLGFASRMIYLGMWGRITLYKYISVWLLTEGACICYGITYNGRDKDNTILWNGCENVNVRGFENVTVFNNYIENFNINTNQWAAEYVYKRLKFFGNKLISQSVTLIFLAIWHGFHSGYYVTFAFEFFIIFFERDLGELICEFPVIYRFFSRHSIMVNIAKRLYTFVFMGYSLIPFAIHRYASYRKAYENIGFIGFYIFMLWPFYKIIVRQILRLTVTLTEIFTRSIPQSEPVAAKPESSQSDKKTD